MSREITLAQFIELYERDAISILDVREAWETPLIRNEHVIQIPINQIPQYLDRIPKTEDLVVICQHGIRSKRVVEYLETQHGFKYLIDLQGGVSSYIRGTS